MSHESKIEGMALSWNSCTPPTRGACIERWEPKDIADMLIFLKFKKEHLAGAMALVDMIRRPIK
jgi:hypothetical protein